MCRKTFFNLNLVQSVKHVCTVLIMQAGLVPLLKRGTRFSYSSTDVLSEQFKHGILHNITQDIPAVAVFLNVASTCLCLTAPLLELFSPFIIPHHSAPLLQSFFAFFLFFPCAYYTFMFTL